MPPTAPRFCCSVIQKTQQLLVLGSPRAVPSARNAKSKHDMVLPSGSRRLGEGTDKMRSPIITHRTEGTAEVGTGPALWASGGSQTGGRWVRRWVSLRAHLVTNQEEVNGPERKLWPRAHCMSCMYPWRARGTREGSSGGPAFLGTTFECICLYILCVHTMYTYVHRVDPYYLWIPYS